MSIYDEAAQQADDTMEAVAAALAAPGPWREAVMAASGHLLKWIDTIEADWKAAGEPAPYLPWEAVTIRRGAEAIQAGRMWDRTEVRDAIYTLALGALEAELNAPEG